MGWFWSEAGETERRPSRPTRPSSSRMRERRDMPPECPMHAKAASGSVQVTSDPPPKSCPVRPLSQTQPAPSRQSPTAGTFSKLNPLNYMPSLSQDRAPHQTCSLPTSRETSSIPRGDMESNWEYPSPQQMYNALLRKGFEDTPADAIESMVAVHNFLNEGAWEEILGWEWRFACGLRKGWDNCIEGEERFEQKALLKAMCDPSSRPAAKLLRLQGRPGDMTPKARILQILGWTFPTRFSSAPPFDRHDWFVQRALPDGSTKEVRYVIDYYSGPPEPTGEPVFFLDVRPAVDTPTAAIERLMRWGGDVWYTASGGSTRLSRS